MFFQHKKFKFFIPLSRLLEPKPPSLVLEGCLGRKAYVRIRNGEPTSDRGEEVNPRRGDDKAVGAYV
jgi:hypothetical protein